MLLLRGCGPRACVLGLPGPPPYPILRPCFAARSGEDRGPKVVVAEKEAEEEEEEEEEEEKKRKRERKKRNEEQEEQEKTFVHCEV